MTGTNDDGTGQVACGVEVAVVGALLVPDVVVVIVVIVVAVVASLVSSSMDITFAVPPLVAMAFFDCAATSCC